MVLLTASRPNRLLVELLLRDLHLFFTRDTCRRDLIISNRRHEALYLHRRLILPRGTSIRR